MPETSTKRLNKSSKLTPLQLHRKVALLHKGVTAADIAREVGVTRQTVSLVLLDRARSRRIEEVIAEILGEPVDALFPPTAA